LGRALLLSYVPLAAFFGILRVEHLYIVTGLVGILTVFFEVADQTFMPILVSRTHILEGNSKRQATAALAEICGPGLAGVLVQVFTAPLAICFDCCSFIFSAFCISLIKTEEPPPKANAEDQNVWREIREGLSVILANPVLRALTLSSATRSFFGNFLATLYVLYAIQIVGLNIAVLGVVIGLGGVGALLGSLVAAPLAQRFGLGKTMLGTNLLAGFIGFLMPLAGGPLSWSILCLALPQLLGDMSIQAYEINALSLRQRLVADDLLGRANATVGFLVDGVGPLGAILAGVLAENIGVRATVWVSVLGMFISVGWLFRFARFKDSE
jgi:predicted MFS family arabinose efflux permease